MAEAYIINAVRTPVGRRGGALRDWHPLDLLAHTLDHLVRHSGADADALDDLIAGCALQRGGRCHSASPPSSTLPLHGRWKR